MALEVRRLEAPDIESIEAREPPGQGFARAMWELQQRGESVLLVAWSDGVPVGSAQLDLRSDPWEVKNLHVDEQARGQGVGTALMAAAERLAAPTGRLTVGVGVDNPRARALYERLGYSQTGQETTTTYEYVDERGARRTATETDVLLVKDLAAAAHI
ncbi:acetyltransferase (GNAT) family protein [Microbacterium sp. SLBN-154]|uniref:GNAT family N-acetyltransferase n=1 Tax=Microbacterium sp. SLBN-154 TaxID=2768458 RepID=UPI00116B53F6|nr:GNAT family N-acetyltransferase [Microbacterium sp. SLBN-154]TQK20810.1 acetyltransferase (GNAT) family protein [Microbacterium sp. SLBN-154]